MPFLRQKDYLKQISADNLQIVTRGDIDIRLESELAAQAQIESYLCHRYDVAAIFIDLLCYDDSTAYTEGQLVAYPDNEGDLYSVLTDTTAGEDPISTPAKWAKGDTRDANIKMFLIDITLYHLHSQVNPRNIPDLRTLRRDEAIQWLDKINSGKISAKLPILETPEDAGLSVKWASNDKFNHKF